ncbi:MAG: SufS family cysteine desulfurase [Alphaproteobacteria bacterium]|nr:SufS family cysteine desulfurase [Alphaproteobacteria bacterium]
MIEGLVGLDAPAHRLDVEALRAEFPILARKVHGRPLVYLDSAASAQKPRAVIEAMARAAETAYANVHRGLHALSNEATDAFEAAREAARGFLGAARPEEIVFTANATDAINLVAASYGRPRLAPGDEIILSEMEHHSNIVPWDFLRREKGVVIRWAPVTESGAFDLAAFTELLSERTKIVAITHMSNVLGTVTPAREIARRAHEAGAVVLFDGSQAAVHLPVDVQAIDADFYVCTGHKLYGPTGIGLLYGRYDLLADMPPYRGGGEMIEVVSREGVSYNAPPHRFEAGTPAILEAVGLHAALDFLRRLGRSSVHAHEAGLLAYASEALGSVKGLRIIGTAPGKGAIVSFVIEGTHPHDLATIIDRQGVAVRAGHHCAQVLMDRFGVSATARASFAAYSTRGEVDALVAALEKARTMLS